MLLFSLSFLHCPLFVSIVTCTTAGRLNKLQRNGSPFCLFSTNAERESGDGLRRRSQHAARKENGFSSFFFFLFLFVFISLLACPFLLVFFLSFSLLHQGTTHAKETKMASALQYKLVKSQASKETGRLMLRRNLPCTF